MSLFFLRGRTMRVQDVMTEGVQTMSADDSVEDAWELMRRHGFHHIVVTVRAHGYRRDDHD
jgi:CBS domain-containing protein